MAMYERRTRVASVGSVSLVLDLGRSQRPCVWKVLVVEVVFNCRWFSKPQRKNSLPPEQDPVCVSGWGQPKLESL
jgi:hypothetical protein